ncbi:MAG: helix-turn-helix domain-containing protein [Alphaproteobacteria bacterium]
MSEENFYRRIELGLSMEKLASSVGLTFQQVQYERGMNRVSASRLFDFAKF